MAWASAWLPSSSTAALWTLMTALLCLLLTDALIVAAAGSWDAEAVPPMGILAAFGLGFWNLVFSRLFFVAISIVSLTRTMLLRLLSSGMICFLILVVVLCLVAQVPPSWLP